jgi:hypothetical protein
LDVKREQFLSVHLRADLILEPLGMPTFPQNDRCIKELARGCSPKPNVELRYVRLQCDFPQPSVKEPFMTFSSKL